MEQPAVGVDPGGVPGEVAQVPGDRLREPPEYQRGKPAHHDSDQAHQPQHGQDHGLGQDQQQSERDAQPPATLDVLDDERGRDGRHCHGPTHLSWLSGDGLREPSQQIWAAGQGGKVRCPGDDAHMAPRKACRVHDGRVLDLPKLPVVDQEHLRIKSAPGSVFRRSEWCGSFDMPPAGITRTMLQSKPKVIRVGGSGFGTSRLRIRRLPLAGSIRAQV